MKISVITVCFNNRSGLEKTIESVIGQTYQNLEYIIIDGGSKDGTVELVQKYQQKFPIIFISELDEGIYDAMNKGIKIASGEWLNFMNSGDTFYQPDSISLAAKYLSKDNDIVYGNTEIRYNNFKIIKKEPRPNKLWMGRIPHQSAFIKASTMKKYQYNKSNKIVADLEFFMRVYFDGGKIKNVQEVFSSFSKDGLTEKFDQQVVKDAYKTVKKLKPGIIVDLYYNALKVKPIIKKILPKKVFKFIKTKI
ncbi:MAG: glycosyltransferase family 2 protein [Patescibacteria group bacterium]